MTTNPKKKRKYKLNWLQILRKMEEAYGFSKNNSAFSQVGVTKPLREVIDALRERLGFAPYKGDQ